MPYIRINISLDAEFLEKLDERARKLSINRSEYLRGLVLRDLEKVKE